MDGKSVVTRQEEANPFDRGSRPWHISYVIVEQ